TVSLAMAPNTDYQIVLKYDIDNAQAQVWVNPAFESDPSSGPNIDVGAVIQPLAGFAFRQAAGEGVLEIANVSVGTNFLDVVTNTPHVPVIGLQPVGFTNLSGNP